MSRTQLDTIFSDSSFIVAMYEELYAPCFVSQGYMPGEEPYSVSAVDLLHDGKVVWIVERDTARFLQDTEDCVEIKFLEPNDWDSTDVAMSHAPFCPGANGYYKEIYRRTHNYNCQ